MFFAFYVDFYWDPLLFYGIYSDSLPWTFNSSRQTQLLPVHSRKPRRLALKYLRSTDRELPDLVP